MADEQSDRLFAEFGLKDRKPPEFFRSVEEVNSAALNGYSHVLRRTWKNFNNLEGVLAIAGRPTVYFQFFSEQKRISFCEQRRFWSNGVAPILVRVTPLEVQVYSGLRSPALAGEDVDGDERLIEVFERTTRALEFRQFLRSVEVGTVYDQHAEHFDPTQAVDRRLVQNLRAAQERMSLGSSAPDLAAIHRVLGRVLFTCYLEAREALTGRDFGRLGAGARATFRDILSLEKPESVRRALTLFFRRLSRYFRGNLFDKSLTDDLINLRDDDLATLRDLIVGNELRTGQQVLPFDVYDFSVIPIETISAVYEDFIRAEGSDEQRSQGAYYTPPKLVEFTVDLATEGNSDLTDKRALDPGCGSGAFLVSVFNRMAEAWVRLNPNARNGTRAKALGRILRDQICGVDLNLIACQATCFSLYMAMLDFLEPREIRRLGAERLPNLLTEGTKSGSEGTPRTVIHGNFLATLPALESRTFHLIVGNPPWVARRNEETFGIELWRWKHKTTDFPMPASQIACAFMWEVPRYLESDGRACLLAPAGILLGDQTDSFQLKWFRRFRVEKVAHLSDLRFVLFPGADHPTVAIRFTGNSPTDQDRFEYLTPKANHASLFDNVIAIEPEDRKQIRLAEVFASAERDEAATLWLGYNWASPRDRDFLSRLLALPRLQELVGEPEEGKRWIKGVGLQPPSKDKELKRPKPRYWADGHPFLATERACDLILTNEDIESVDPELKLLRRLPDHRVFKSPLVVFNKGFTKIAYSPFDVLFQDARRSISGPLTDKDLLMFLAATFVSPLAAYFVFNLTSKPIYRGAILLNELIRIPFPLPENAPCANGHQVIKAAARMFELVTRDKRFRNVGHRELIIDTKRELARLVYSYFDVNSEEEVLVDDSFAILQRSATPSFGSNVPILSIPGPNDRQRYASMLIDTLQTWTGANIVNLGARCVLSEKAGLAVVTIAKTRGGTKYAESKATTEMDQVLSRLRDLSPERYGSLVYLRNLAVMDADRIHIVKPLTMRFWLRSAALNDADAAASYLLTRKAKG